MEAASLIVIALVLFAAVSASQEEITWHTRTSGNEVVAALKSASDGSAHVVKCFDVEETPAVTRAWFGLGRLATEYPKCEDVEVGDSWLDLTDEVRYGY